MDDRGRHLQKILKIIIMIKTNEQAFEELALDVEVVTPMIGVVFSKIETDEAEIIFHSGDKKIRFFHDQDCCEEVTIDDICGDIEDLLCSPIIKAQVVSTKNEAIRKVDDDDSHTWTFYQFATIKGSVTVRWVGESNGYYSESVDVDFSGFDEAMVSEFLETQY